MMTAKKRAPTDLSPFAGTDPFTKYQGEPSSAARAKRGGTGRVVLVTGNAHLGGR